MIQSAAGVAVTAGKMTQREFENSGKRGKGGELEDAADCRL